jgi:hypothetical protein
VQISLNNYYQLKNKYMNTKLIEKIEREQVAINPSYDKKLSIEERLADFLGAYHILLNGVKAHEPFYLKYEGKPNDRCDKDDKQRIIDFVKNSLFSSYKSQIIKECIESLPKKKTNEDYMKQLNAPCSDYTYGHSHGQNEAIDQIKNNLELLVKK